MKKHNQIQKKEISKNLSKSTDSSYQNLIVYTDTQSEVFESINLSEIQKRIQKNKINWIHLNTQRNIETVNNIGYLFNFHPLLLEDIINIESLPKIEYYNDHLVFTLKMISIDKNKEIRFEHLSIVLGNYYLLTIQENAGDFYNQVKERSLNYKDRIEKNGIDFLFYIIIDMIVDKYFNVMEYFRDQLDEIEDLLVENPELNYIHRLHELRKKIVSVRKFVFSLLESIQNMISDEPAQISENNSKYFNDIKDHLHYNFQLIESFKEDQRGLVELNQSHQSNNMTRVMKTLTIVTSIFIPLTFIVGLYGMNFKYMPELSWKWGYFGVLGFMVFVSLVMIWYMKRKKWF